MEPRSRRRKKKWILLETCLRGASATYVHVKGPSRQATSPTLSYANDNEPARSPLIQVQPTARHHVSKSNSRHAVSVMHDTEILAARIMTTTPTDQVVSYSTSQTRRQDGAPSRAGPTLHASKTSTILPPSSTIQARVRSDDSAVCFSRNSVS